MPAPIIIARAVSAAEAAAARAGASATAQRIAAQAAGKHAVHQLSSRGNLLSGLRGTVWDVQAWDALFERYSPKIIHKIEVKAQGSPLTPINSVVHLALATAFGCVPFAPQLASSIAFTVAVSHTTNAVEISFEYSFWAMGELGIEGMKNVLRRLGKVGRGILRTAEGGVKLEPDKIKDGVQDIVEGVPPFVGKIVEDIVKDPFGLKEAEKDAKPSASPNWPANPGNKNTAPGTPPVIPDNKVKEDKAGDENAKKKKALEEAANRGGLLQRTWGTLLIYNLGRDVIRGGVPPGIFDPPKPGDRPEPFGSMVGQTILTRDKKAGNPQPPTEPPAVLYGGMDLRSLVAQVLHDPGVRPPLPRTASGPPPVVSELKGE